MSNAIRHQYSSSSKSVAQTSRAFSTVSEVDISKLKDLSSTVPTGSSTEGPGFDYEAAYETQIQKLQDKSYRYFNNINRLAKNFPHAHRATEADEVTVWCANDYLGMGSHPKVIKAMHETIDKYGAGAGGTRNIAGHNMHALKLEASIADLHRTEAALVFTSCFVANDATLALLGNKLPNCVYFSDQMNHASMIEGIRHSKTEKVIWNTTI